MTSGASVLLSLIALIASGVKATAAHGGRGHAAPTSPPWALKAFDCNEHHKCGIDNPCGDPSLECRTAEEYWECNETGFRLKKQIYFDEYNRQFDSAGRRTIHNLRDPKLPAYSQWIRDTFFSHCMCCVFIPEADYDDEQLPPVGSERDIPAWAFSAEPMRDYKIPPGVFMPEPDYD
ncbi:unnamed protein product [Vitrella brassicaformis CCMP3155]|uniref:Uncharacterized protein n=1 Tax=Vitrella brassicaformis (strain CCMP3155) TaxID=1169540 RepID=A0A0G4G3E7_VITBC|nr:unnamed protein product [Vitrella brassicaformis CCMP3155]|eukprot:CEM22672.1 unnamed protein product [Vitrella brassicaformis CCMP3155]